MLKKIKNRQFLIDVGVFVFLPLLVNIVIESMGNKALLGGIKKLINDPYVFFCNTLIIAAMVSVGVFFKRFRYFWVGIVCTCWLTLGTLNCILINNRVLPLTAYDLNLVDVLPFIIKKYLNPAVMAVICLCVVAAVLGIFIMFFRALSAPKGKISLKRSALFFVTVVALTYGNLKCATAAGVLETSFPELPKSFVRNGFVYSFMVSLTDNGIKEVDGYSQKLIDSITDGFSSADKNEVTTPNVVFVQMESFFDLNALNNVEFDKNPVPNLTRFCKENPSGLVTVPVIGAGTVNTEFEVMTGMRVGDFGAGEYPYKTVLSQKSCESIANNLKPYGYTSHFIHNYTARFYGRNTVYANLGYDYFYSIEYMSDYENNANGWAKDEILIRYINESLDRTVGHDLINAVSVQAHGGYDGEKEFTKHVSVTDCDDKTKRSAYEYYANQIYEMDAFIGALTESLSARDEKTVLVVYGDHLPSLDFVNSDLEGRNVFQTDYFIWNNAGIEYDGGDINAYHLSSKVLEGINVKDGVINACHQTYKDDEKYSFNLQALEYDMLYGERYASDGEAPYPVSDMKINSRLIAIESIEPKPDKRNRYVIKGVGFTKKSCVQIGFSIVRAKFIDENTLEFSSKIDSEVPVCVFEKNVGKSEEYYIK